MKNTWRILGSIAFLTSMSGHVSATTLAGDNESGLEFPSSSGQCDWFSPDPTFAIQSGHARIIRLPYLAECAVPTALGAINASYMNIIKQIIGTAANSNVPVVLDMHDYGYVHGQDITTASGEADFLDVHNKVIDWLKANLTPQQFSLLVIGLMNEPHVQTDAAYRPVFQSAINELRKDGFSGKITYPGTGYSGAHNLSVNSTFMSGVTDPANNLLAEVHQYFDSDYSGTHDVPISGSGLGQATLSGAEQWSARTGIPLILDETGDPQPVNGNGTIPASFPAGAWQQSDQYFRQFMADAVSSGRFYAIIAWGGGQYWGGYMFNDYIYNGSYTPTGQTYSLLSYEVGG